MGAGVFEHEAVPGNWLLPSREGERGAANQHPPHCIVGMTNSAPSFVPEGQREVIVLVRV